MRIGPGGPRRRIANADAACVRFPCVDQTQDPAYEGPMDVVRSLDPVVREKSAAAPQGAAYGSENRVAKHEVYWFLRPYGAWSSDQWSGLHGIVRPRQGDASQQAGGMQPWDAPRRTLRSAPLVSWDAGTALGAA